MPMSVIVTVMFGTRNEAAAWIVEQQISELPPIGMRVRIRLGGGDDDALDAQVYRTWPEDESDLGGLFVYAGPTLPPDRFAAAMASEGWEEVSEEGVRILLDAVESTPAIAAIHEVTLLIGDPCDPALVAVQRTLRPADPALPLFSQRLRLEALADIPVEDLDREDGTEGEDARDHYLADVAAIEAELADPTSIDPALRGLPVITLYSAMVQTGMGRVVFWAPASGAIDVLDLVANDWAPIRVPAQFDPEDFRLARRIELARRTSLTFEETPFGTLAIKDWEVDDPGEVTEDDSDLIPRLLLEHCRAEVEFVGLPDLLNLWAQTEAGPAAGPSGDMGSSDTGSSDTGSSGSGSDSVPGASED